MGSDEPVWYSSLSGPFPIGKVSPVRGLTIRNGCDLLLVLLLASLTSCSPTCLFESMCRPCTGTGTLSLGRYCIPDPPDRWWTFLKGCDLHLSELLALKGALPVLACACHAGSAWGHAAGSGGWLPLDSPCSCPWPLRIRLSFGSSLYMYTASSKASWLCTALVLVVDATCCTGSLGTISSCR